MLDEFSFSLSLPCLCSLFHAFILLCYLTLSYVSFIYIVTTVLPVLWHIEFSMIEDYSDSCCRNIQCWSLIIYRNAYYHIFASKTLSAEEEDIYLLKHITIMAIPNTSINRARLPENPKVNNAGHSKNTKAANKYKTKKHTSLHQYSYIILN